MCLYVLGESLSVMSESESEEYMGSVDGVPFRFWCRWTGWANSGCCCSFGSLAFSAGTGTSVDCSWQNSSNFSSILSSWWPGETPFRGCRRVGFLEFLLETSWAILSHFLAPPHFRLFWHDLGTVQMPEPSVVCTPYTHVETPINHQPITKFFYYTCPYIQDVFCSGLNTNSLNRCRLRLLLVTCPLWHRTTRFLFS